MTGGAGRDRWPSAMTALCALLGLVVVVLCLATMYQFGLLDLYADQWRTYPRIVALPFPDSVVFLENGHRPVTANLIRLADVVWFSGDQRLLLWVGLVLVVATVGILVAVVACDRTLPREARAAGALVVVIGVCWLANARMLTHPYEANHTYLITTCLALIIWLAVRPNAPDAGTIGWRRPIAVCVLGFIATFSFGPGICVFAAALVALWLRRENAAVLVAVAAGAALAAAFYLAMPGADGVRNVIAIEPLRNGRVLLQWLAAPVMYAVLPLLDPNALVPGAPAVLASIAQSSAHAYERTFGSAWESAWPQAVVGGLGVGAAIVLGWKARRSGTGISGVAGLALVGFALAVGSVIALSRLDYFAQYPSQTYANRYLPWSCLFWAGLLLATLAECCRGTPAIRPAALRILVPLMGIVAVVTGISHRGWARDVQAVANTHTLAVVTGAFDSGQPLGETLLVELIAGVPVLRDRGIGPFARPEYQTVARGAGGTDAGPNCVVGAQAVSAPNAFGGSLWRITAPVVDAAASADQSEEWLLADAAGNIVGFLQATQQQGAANGASRIDPASQPLRLVRPRDGRRSTMALVGERKGEPTAPQSRPACAP